MIMRCLLINQIILIVSDKSPNINMKLIILCRQEDMLFFHLFFMVFESTHTFSTFPLFYHNINLRPHGIFSNHISSPASQDKGEIFTRYVGLTPYPENSFLIQQQMLCLSQITTVIFTSVICLLGCQLCS